MEREARPGEDEDEEGETKLAKDSKLSSAEGGEEPRLVRRDGVLMGASSKSAD